jgi:pimeloyl-ACP methyl ester carboxylesterase
MAIKVARRIAAAVLCAVLRGQDASDNTPHSVQFITVEKGVKLEVLDWGGTGRPILLLTGLGNDAHIFDKFAPRLTEKYHVYGITRRGFGQSSAPAPTAANYSADRLGDDVLALIDQLKLSKPVLAAHSLGGEELSSIGSRFPEKVAGLIYLDAGYTYAYYNSARPDFNIEMNELQMLLDKVRSKRNGDLAAIEELLARLPDLEKLLLQQRKKLASSPTPPTGSQPITGAIIAGERKYTTISTPVLAIYATPKPPPALKLDAKTLEDIVAAQSALDEAQAKAFEAGVPTAHVVRIPNADHYIFLSNEADVLRAMNEFINGLP